MNLFFDASDLGFYEESKSGRVEVTPEQHDEFLTEIYQHGKILKADENGRPVLADPPAPTTEQLSTKARAERDTKLTATNWLVERHREEQETGTTTLTAQEYAELLAYRQALRDVPQQPGFPESIQWPVIPEF